MLFMAACSTFFYIAFVFSVATGIDHRISDSKAMFNSIRTNLFEIVLDLAMFLLE